MVDKTPNATTQLPISTQIEKVLMHGSTSQLKQAIREQMDEVPFNELELQLLDRFLSEPQESAAKVVDLLTRAKNRLHENKRAEK